MVMIRTAASLACLALLASWAAAQETCRPTALGAVGCLGPTEPPPRARPPGEPLKDGLQQVLDAVATVPDPAFVPARRTNRLGTTLPERPVSGPCRRDSLGHLRCP
jgi:hypothetical protein